MSVLKLAEHHFVSFSMTGLFMQKERKTNEIKYCISIAFLCLLQPKATSLLNI